VTLVLAAHGTRQASGVEQLQRLASAVRSELDGRTVQVGFVDVLGPTPAELLREIDGPAVVVPAFLASGYHVRSDVPREVAESGHTDVAVTRALGPDPALARVGVERLREAGWQEGDTVVLAAAGSSDAHATAQVQCAACMLGIELGRPPVAVGYVATASPRVPEAVTAARAAGAVRVVVAPYLLAPGLFHTGLAQAGADAVAAPLGVHPQVVALVVDRYLSALVPATA
jgi:sirohydrochlorin ferrochelatase